MSLISLINAFNRLKNFFNIFFLKVVFKKRLIFGSNIRLKCSSRIQIFEKSGKIIIGDEFTIGHSSELYAWGGTVEIGNNTSINDNCKIYGDVKIGDNCVLASNIYISSGSHNIKFAPQLPIKVQDELNVINKPVVIEDDCWIGFGVVIMPGIYIGKGAVVGSNAVVTKNIHPYTINAGIPAKEINSRLDFKLAYQELRADCIEHFPFFYRGCHYQQFLKPESVKNGVEVGEKSIFIFKKKSGLNLTIKGSAKHCLVMDIYINSSYQTSQELPVGPFEKTLTLGSQLSSLPFQQYQIPEVIEKDFDVLFIKISTASKSSKLGYIWVMQMIKLS